MSARVACLLVPHFAAAAVERGEPALRERPLVIVTGAPPVTRVVDASDAARERGVLPPITEAEARRRCPPLVTRALCPDTLASARLALLDAALGVSPRIEDAAPGLVYVDIAGLGRLIGDDAAVGARLVRLASAVGLPPRVGIAGSRIAARVAAVQGPSRVSVIPPGGERAAIAPTPITVLDLTGDLAATLARWGVSTLGDLAALPRSAFADRLGPAALRAHEQALGRDREPFRAYTPPPFWEEVQGLDWEIDTLPALTVALDRVLDRLARRLDVAHVAADALTVQLQLASGDRCDRTVPLAYPMVDVAPMLTVLRVALEAHPPEAAVTRITLSARVVPARAAVRGLWEPPVPAPRDLGAVLARLVALVGVEHVGSPVLVDSHRPDAFALTPFAAGEGAATRLDPGTSPLALRRLRPPRAIAVECRRGDTPREGSGGAVAASMPPLRVALDGRTWLTVLAAAGPWRVSGEWWDTRAWACDEWDLALADGTLARVARDRLTGNWHLDGAYD